MNELVDISYEKNGAAASKFGAPVFLRWIVKHNQVVGLNQKVAEIDTGAATVQIGSPVVGRLQDMLATRGQSVRPGQIVGRVLVHSEEADQKYNEQLASKILQTKRAVANDAAPAPSDEQTNQPALEEPETPEISAEPTTQSAPDELKQDEPDAPPADEQNQAETQADSEPDAATETDSELAVATEPAAEDVETPPPSEAADEQDEPPILEDVDEPERALAALKESFALADSYEEAFPESLEESLPSSPAPSSPTLPATTRAVERYKPQITQIEFNASHRTRGEYIADALLNRIPHISVTALVDLTQTVATVKQQYPQFEINQPAPLLTARVIAAAREAMRAEPELNAHYQDGALTIYEEFNVNLRAVSAKGKTVAPLIAAPPNRAAKELAADLKNCLREINSGAVKADMLKTGIFTICDGMRLGALMTAPIVIMRPQVAALGIGALHRQTQLEQNSGAETPSSRIMSYATLTVDARAVDDYQANQWLNAFKTALEAGS